MDWFNQVIQEIRSKRISPTLIRKNIGNELYRQGEDQLLSRYYLKRRTPPQITIYYPISYQDQFPPIPVQYGEGAVSVEDLLKSIWVL